MSRYEFITIWRITAPLQDVWDEIYHSERWPRWWRGVERVEELQPGDARGIGSIRRYTWRSKLPYKLTFNMRVTRIEPPTLLEGVAEGELSGTGRWQLHSEGDITVVRYDWQVETTKRWMNLLAPLARPIFKWNHDVIMHWGAEGLKQRMKDEGGRMN